MSAAAVERPAPRPSADDAPRLRGVREAAWLPWVVLAVVMAGAFALLIWAGRDTTFFYDDWPYVQDRTGWNPRSLLAPHVDHLQVTTVFIYKVLFETVGLHHYAAYRAVLALLNVTTAVLLFVYGRRRIGPWPSLGLAACLVVMAPSWYNLVFAFQMNFVLACATGLGALLAFDRGGRRWDALGSLLLCVSIGSSSVGFPFLIGAAVEVLMRGDRWRRIWIVVVPAVLYGAWRLRYADGSSAELGNLDAIPGWILNGLDDPAAAIVGTSREFGVVVGIGLVAIVVRELLDPERVTPRLVALIVMPLSMWVLTALGRAHQGIESDENRYLYVTGLLLALLGMEAARRYDLRGRPTAILTVLLAFGAVTNAVGVDNGGQRLREWSAPGKYAATALDIAGHLKPPEFNEADPTQPFIKAGWYLAATQKYGSTPGYTMEELLRETPENRRGVDEALLRVHESGFIHGDAPTAPSPPRVELETRGAVAEVTDCVRFVPGEASGELDVEIPASGIVVRAGDAKLELWVRRFSTLFPGPPLDALEPGSSGSVVFKPDKAQQPWHARLRSDAPFSVCTHA
ncbi:MAG TPA: hypothetical protein VHF89_10435 [Solirubrobacteraceae bacterium]|nr:hypothetical protein [Solirubrobacteraceae bacterium]